MELPANPNQLYLTGYDEYGRPFDANEAKKQQLAQQNWQLSDSNSYSTDDLYDQSSAFGIEGGIF